MDSASHPSFKVGGRLRPMVRTALASLLMYYSERVEAGEAREVRIRMKQVPYHAWLYLVL